MSDYPGADGNGLTLEEVFKVRPGVGLTFDDLLILPRFVETPPAHRSVSLKMAIAPGLEVNPIISSPMDMVTEWRMASQMAMNGCLGVLHMNLGPEEMVRQVRKVKRFQMGFIWDPLCRKPDDPVDEARRVKQDYGFSTIVVTEDGTPNSKFLGIVTRSCVDLVEPHTALRSLADYMLTATDLEKRGLIQSRKEVSSLDDAKSFFREDPQLTKLPILNEDGTVYALVNRNNLALDSNYPDMLVDDNRQLRVAAAVSTHAEDDERVRMVLEAGVDAIVIDSSQGGTGYAVDRITKLRWLSSDIPIIAGNVVTPAQAKPLIEAGANIVRVGMGSGSICITQGQYGLGRAQGSAVYSNPGCIADGGIRDTGDMLKALALGASFVMAGSFLAGCDESPGEIVEYKGRRWKPYRGMGSAGAMRDRGAVRYGGKRGYNPREVVVQGIEGHVPACGPLDDRLAETFAALRGALSQLGCTSISELHNFVRNGNIRFELRSEAAKREGSTHTVSVLG